MMVKIGGNVCEDMQVHGHTREARHVVRFHIYLLEIIWLSQSENFK